jgi:putative transposase
MDFLLTAKQDCKAALRFLRKEVGHNRVPKTLTIGKSGANAATIESYKVEHEVEIKIRQVKYLNNIVEQDQPAIKRLPQPMLGFELFWIRKSQSRSTGKLRFT